MSSEAATGSGAPAPVAYLVLAHHRPTQVVRLAARILGASPDAVVLIHWDRAAREVLDASDLPERARVIADRVAVRWGTWSMVQATLALLRAASESVPRPAWHVLISGDDWPAVDLAAWERDLGAREADAVVHSEPLVDRWAAGERAVPLPEDEVRRYGERWHVIPATGRPPVDRVLLGVARRLSTRVPPRGYPAVFDFYGRGAAIAFRRGAGLPPGWQVRRGDQWITLNARAAGRVLAVDERVTRHFRGVLIPDEAYLHTILHNTPGLCVLAGRTSFAPWARFDRVPHLVLRPEDLADVRASGAPFARKVGDDELGRVVEDLDRLANGRPRRGGTPS